MPRRRRTRLGLRRVILTLTPNPALDVTYAVERLDVGASHRVRSVVERAGGKGVNVASVLHRLGHGVEVHGPVGGAVGDQIVADLRDRGIPNRMTQVESPSRRTVTVVENDGSATVLNEPGALSGQQWAAVLADLRTVLPGAAVLVASGSLPGGITEDAYADVVRLAHDHGCPVVVDTSGPALLAAVEAGPDLVKPNHHELREVTGRADPVDGARELQRRGARTVVVSCGADGLVLLSPDGTVRSARPREPLQGNATGAGDAGVAALARGLVAGDGPRDLLRSAVGWSAAAVLSPVAGDLDPGTVPDLCAAVIEGDA